MTTHKNITDIKNRDISMDIFVFATSIGAFGYIKINDP